MQSQGVSLSKKNEFQSQASDLDIESLENKNHERSEAEITKDCIKMIKNDKTVALGYAQLALHKISKTPPDVMMAVKSIVQTYHHQPKEDALNVLEKVIKKMIDHTIKQIGDDDITKSLEETKAIIDSIVPIYQKNKNNNLLPKELIFKLYKLRAWAQIISGNTKEANNNLTLLSAFSMDNDDDNLFLNSNFIKQMLSEREQENENTGMLKDSIKESKDEEVVAAIKEFKKIDKTIFLWRYRYESLSKQIHTMLQEDSKGNYDLLIDTLTRLKIIIKELKSVADAFKKYSETNNDTIWNKLFHSNLYIRNAIFKYCLIYCELRAKKVEICPVEEISNSIKEAQYAFTKLKESITDKSIDELICHYLEAEMFRKAYESFDIEKDSYKNKAIELYNKALTIKPCYLLQLKQIRFTLEKYNEEIDYSSITQNSFSDMFKILNSIKEKDCSIILNSIDINKNIAKDIPSSVADIQEKLLKIINNASKKNPELAREILTELIGFTNNFIKVAEKRGSKINLSKNHRIYCNKKSAQQTRSLFPVEVGIIESKSNAEDQKKVESKKSPPNMTAEKMIEAELLVSKAKLLLQNGELREDAIDEAINHLNNAFRIWYTKKKVKRDVKTKSTLKTIKIQASLMLAKCYYWQGNKREQNDQNYNKINDLQKAKDEVLLRTLQIIDLGVTINADLQRKECTEQLKLYEDEIKKCNREQRRKAETKSQLINNIMIPSPKKPAETKIELESSIINRELQSEGVKEKKIEEYLFDIISENAFKNLYDYVKEIQTKTGMEFKFSGSFVYKLALLYYHPDKTLAESMDPSDIDAYFISSYPRHYYDNISKIITGKKLNGCQFKENSEITNPFYANYTLERPTSSSKEKLDTCIDISAQFWGYNQSPSLIPASNLIMTFADAESKNPREISIKIEEKKYCIISEGKDAIGVFNDCKNNQFSLHELPDPCVKSATGYFDRLYRTYRKVPWLTKNDYAIKAFSSSWQILFFIKKLINEDEKSCIKEMVQMFRKQGYEQEDIMQPLQNYLSAMLLLKYHSSDVIKKISRRDNETDAAFIARESKIGEDLKDLADKKTSIMAMNIAKIIRAYLKNVLTCFDVITTDEMITQFEFAQNELMAMTSAQAKNKQSNEFENILTADKINHYVNKLKMIMADRNEKKSDTYSSARILTVLNHQEEPKVLTKKIDAAASVNGHQSRKRLNNKYNRKPIIPPYSVVENLKQVNPILTDNTRLESVGGYLKK